MPGCENLSTLEEDDAFSEATLLLGVVRPILDGDLLLLLANLEGV